mgnify:CR=1 FL=1
MVFHSLRHTSVTYKLNEQKDTGGSRSRTADESTWQSGDGGFAYFSGEDNESINIEERYCVE